MSVVFVEKEDIKNVREEIGHYYSNPRNIRVPNRYSNIAPAGLRPCRLESFTNGAKLVYLFNHEGI